MSWDLGVGVVTGFLISSSWDKSEPEDTKSRPYGSSSWRNCFYRTGLPCSNLTPRTIAVRRNSLAYFIGVFEEIDPFQRFPFTRTQGEIHSVGGRTIKKLVSSKFPRTTNSVRNYVSLLQWLWEPDRSALINLSRALSMYVFDLLILPDLILYLY